MHPTHSSRARCVIRFQAVLLLGMMALTAAVFARAETAVFNGVEYTRQPWGIERPVPVPSAEDQERGWVAFVPSITDGIGPDYRPVKAEIGAPMQAFCSPGEQEPVTFAVYALRDTPALQIDSGPIISARGRPLQGAHLDIRAVRIWPQRTSWRSSSYSLIPEILEYRPTPVSAGKVQQFWVTIAVPPDTLPDLYQGYLRVSEGPRAAVIPLRLRVLPFVLPEPKDRHWGLWPDSSRWKTWDSSYVLAEMTDWRGRRITRCILYPLTHGVFTWQDGAIRADLTEFERQVSLYLQAGLDEPVVISLQGVAGLVRRLRGLEPEDYGAEFAETLLQIAESIEDLRIRKAWPRFIYHTVDEPGGHPAVQREALETLRILHDAGYRTFTTADVDFTNQVLDPHVDVRCYGLGFCAQSPEQAQARRDECQASGDEFWWYGIGCYTGQEGSLAVNRHLGGFLFYNTGARGCWAWTYQRPNGDPYDDFDGTGAQQKDACLTYPRRAGAGSAVPTLQWEGIREAIDDVRYLELLDRALSELDASSSPAAASTARRTRAEVHGILRDVPWLSQGELSSDAAQVLRWRVCELLYDCAQALGGSLARPTAELSPRQGKPVVDAAPVASTRAEFEPPVPAASIPFAAVPPTVDGDLDDWDATREFARLGDPHGHPARRATRVYAVRDRSRLYVAFRCDEDQMDRVRAEISGNDGPVWTDDSVEVFLGGGADPRNYHHFVVNSRGARYDARVRIQGELSQTPPASVDIHSDDTWNANWEAAAGVCQGGWCVEISLPLSALNWDGTRALYANFARTRRAPEGPEYALWSPTFAGYHHPARLGRLILNDCPILPQRVQCSPPLSGTNHIALDLLNPSDVAEAQVTITVQGTPPVRTRTVLLPGSDRLIVPCELDAPALRIVTVQVQPLSVWAAEAHPPAGPLDERDRQRLLREIRASDRRPVRAPALTIPVARWLSEPLELWLQRSTLLAGQPGVDLCADLNLDTGLLRRSSLEVTVSGPECSEQTTLEPGATGRVHLHIGTASLKPGKYEVGVELTAQDRQLQQTRVPLTIHASPWN